MDIKYKFELQISQIELSVALIELVGIHAGSAESLAYFCE